MRCHIRPEHIRWCALRMLHINDVIYRIEGRTILDAATVAIPSGHKVGLVGRNGVGKSTLLKIIRGDLALESGTITTSKSGQIGYVEQEAPGDDRAVVDWVLSCDRERADLLAEADVATDPMRIADIQLRLTDISAHSAPARAATILAGLGFDEAAQQQPCHAFSGGWRMRIALASVLFLEPEILLLDEPTNYLDLEGTLWLETYLKSYPHTVVIVSHDRELLNQAVTHIVHLAQGKLTIFTGGYDNFEKQRRQQQSLELKLKKKQDDERRRIQTFIDRFRAKATKASQAQSRIKALAKLEPIVAQIEDQVAPIVFPNPEKMRASPLLRFEDVSVGYTPDKPVLTNLNLRIDQDDRIALLGQNGNGKSTFAKLISAKLAATHGKVFGAKQISTGYFAQHQLDELNPGQTPYQVYCELLPEATEAQRRARLGAAGFGADKADVACGKLSGGEKARLMLALAAFYKPQLLILDEPTNHLDIDSRQALIHGLAEYEGAVILISHDPHLIEASADRLWLVENGTVTSFDGDIQNYRSEVLAKRRTKQREHHSESAKQSGQHSPKLDRAEQRRRAAEQRAALAPLRKAVKHHEKSVQEWTKKIATLDAVLADPDVYMKDPDKAQRAGIERGQCAQALQDAEDNWLQAVTELEAAQVDID